MGTEGALKVCLVLFQIGLLIELAVQIGRLEPKVIIEKGENYTEGHCDEGP